MYFKLKIILILAAVLSVSGCTSVQKKDGHAERTPQESKITLLFAGDIMAHRPNFNMTDYSKIWRDVQEPVLLSDLAFANIESPVDESRPFSTFPNFNMHPSYPEAAVNAGFNVFSLVNNHTNDQGLDGMTATLDWAQKMQETTAFSDRPLYFNGINKTPDEDISYRIIKKGSWTVLFCAVTEILNRNDYKSYMNYMPADETARKAFIEYVSKLRKENNCDLFILSFHSNEPEYVAAVSKEQRSYYYKLLDAGIDVIWANHPHVVRERELIGSIETGCIKKLIMYGNGNTISAQRWEPRFDSPSNARDNTGDGLMFSVTYTKSANGMPPEITETKPYYITTYINTAWEFVIKNLDDNFIQYLKDAKRTDWASYIEERKKITENTKEILTWQ